jgi:hypothetical protein
VRLLIAMVALVLLAASSASAGTSAPRPPASIVIKLKSVSIASLPNDKPPAGASKGDRVLIRDRLLNVSRQFGKPAGAVVGGDAGLLVYTSKTSATYTGVTTLPGGTIRIRGTLEFSGASPLGIVDGGTGRYAHAHGTLFIGSGTTPLNTYRLTLTTARAASGDCPACSA